MKAKELLDKMWHAPGMYASNKEAFCAIVSTALHMEDILVDNKFYQRHIGGRGNIIEGCNDPFGNDWARDVVEDAFAIMEDSKKPCKHLEEFHKQYEAAEDAGTEPKPCICG